MDALIIEHVECRVDELRREARPMAPGAHCQPDSSPRVARGSPGADPDSDRVGAGAR